MNLWFFYVCTWEFQTFHTLIDSDVKRSWINCLWQTNKKAKVKTKPTRRWTYCDKALLYVNLKSWSMPLLPSISFNFCSYPKFIAFLTRRWKIYACSQDWKKDFVVVIPYFSSFSTMVLQENNFKVISMGFIDKNISLWHTRLKSSIGEPVIPPVFCIKLIGIFK